MSGLNAIDVAAYLAAGASLGAVYFVLLFRTLRLHASQAAAIRIIPLYILRVSAAVLAFWIVAQEGALALLLSLFGFLVARIVIQRQMGSES